MPTPAPIVLFTDFGSGPYAGQMKAVLWRLAPDARVIDLIDDAPAHDPMLAAYLLAAYGPEIPIGSVILAVGAAVPGPERGIDTLIGRDWPDDLARIVYIDRFGNAMTGLRAVTLGPDAAIAVAGRRLARARTFSDLPVGAPFWYENANGLAEIAVNQGRADRALGIGVGDAVAIDP